MSVKIQFPPNPENGMIFELIPGVYYKYVAGSNSWVRLKGVDALGLATPLSDGLMSKDDYTKLQNLIVPPPQATLKGEDCQTTFKSGTVGLYSFDESLEISKNPKIMNKGVNPTSVPWNLHKNTAGFDFKIPMDRILKEIEDRSQLKKVKLQGDKGAKGKRGEAGLDKVDTGPVGATGPAGLNSPFTGNLATETIPFELVSGNNNRAIVDVSTEEVSEDENYLVLTRANIGDPDACPALVSPKEFNSALVVALNTAASKLVRDQTVSSGDCTLTCRICASSVHHVNMEEIVSAIFDQFVVRVQNLKLEKEALARAWLSTMISLFSEQKAALCCALENCRSRSRNIDARRYIESQRIQAYQAEAGVIVDGENDRQYTEMDSYKDCPVNAIPEAVEYDGDCVTVTIDPRLHTVDPTLNVAQRLVISQDPDNPGRRVAPILSVPLAAGTYVAEIVDCCAVTNISNSEYTGRAVIAYQAQIEVDGETTVEQKNLYFPDFGTFNSNSAAKNAYQGVTLTFNHNGGDAAFWLDAKNAWVGVESSYFTDSSRTGSVKVKICPITATQVSTATTGEEVEKYYIYKNDITTENYLGEVVPFVGDVSAEENTVVSSNPIKSELLYGPTLLSNTAQGFFYRGTDGLSFFYVVGKTQDGLSDTDRAILDLDPNYQIVFRLNVTDNTSVTAIRASSNTVNGSIVQTSTSDYTGTVEAASIAGIIGIGELDSNADFSVALTPEQLGAMKYLVAATASSGEDIVIAEGGSDGLGSVASAGQTAIPLYSVTDVPTSFGGGNTTGIRIDNTRQSGQSVYLSRTVELDSASNIVDVTLGIQSSTIQSIRYILTDNNGMKYYSAYASTDLSKLNQFHNLDLGLPVSVLAPPSEFDAQVLSSQNVDVNQFVGQLTSSQLSIASNLSGVSRLTYIQSLIGSPVDEVPIANTIVYFELEIKSMPISTLDLGVITAETGSGLDLLIDNFPLATVTSVQGSIKRVVATQTGTDSSTSGLICTGLTSYYGDYEGYDDITKASIDLHGNNFFTYNEAQNRLIQITATRGFNKLSGADFTDGIYAPGDISILDSGVSLELTDSILVDDFGIVYILDPKNGRILVAHANTIAAGNRSLGDANDKGLNWYTPLISGLPIVDKASIVRGKKSLHSVFGSSFIDELIVNWGGTLYKTEGFLQVLDFYKFATAFRGDLTTPRCCYNDNPPVTTQRMRALGPTGLNVWDKIGSDGLIMNSLTVDRKGNPQPSRHGKGGSKDYFLPGFGPEVVSAELERDFGTFSLYGLANDNEIYLIDQTTGDRTLLTTLDEPAFDLTAHPRTKDLYYIVNDGGTTPASGTTIARINPITGQVTTVYTAGNGEKIFSIAFANTIPTDLTNENQTLYALLSTFNKADSGQSVTTRLVEITENLTPPNLDSPVSAQILTDSVWTLDFTGDISDAINKVYFTNIPPGQGCQMYYKQVQWYERGWRIGSCCGALVELDGVYYIVVKRSLGIDGSCGGGESINTPCISEFIEEDGHPAIAWPTSPVFGDPPGGGGEEFLGMPTSGYANFVKDEDLSNALISKIQAGDIIESVGDPVKEITFIIFPAS